VEPFDYEEMNPGDIETNFIRIQLSIQLVETEQSGYITPDSLAVAIL